MAVVQEAVYGIPHCDFTKTERGFIVKYKGQGLSGKSIMKQLGAGAFMIGGFIVAAIIALFIGSTNHGNGPGWTTFFILLIVVVGLTAFLFKDSHKETCTIEVNEEYVTIDNKALLRKDFFAFNQGGNNATEILKKMARSANNQLFENLTNFAQLSYQYGSNTFTFGPAIYADHAVVIAAGLNQHLRATPLGGDIQQPSQEVLRQAARPADF